MSCPEGKYQALTVADRSELIATGEVVFWAGRPPRGGDSHIDGALIEARAHFGPSDRGQGVSVTRLSGAAHRQLRLNQEPLPAPSRRLGTLPEWPGRVHQLPYPARLGPARHRGKRFEVVRHDVEQAQGVLLVAQLQE
jgi:hypothetical protein